LQADSEHPGSEPANAQRCRGHPGGPAGEKGLTGGGSFRYSTVVKKVIIQIPCFNEEKYLPLTLADLPRTLEGVATVEYLVVDDGSTDRTAETARANGVHHVVRLPGRRGLARAFMEGVRASLENGADIIVNTDADNQYRGEDVAALIRPILEGKAEMVIGERPIMDIAHMSFMTKIFQKVGSSVVRLASGTEVPDAPSGFRAFTRHAALQMNVFLDYTYTLETIIQAGHHNLSVVSVPIRTNPKLRESRLIRSLPVYVVRSAATIIRIFVIYKPLRFFLLVGGLFILIGATPVLRFLYLYLTGSGAGNIQSLVLGTGFIVIGFQLALLGFMAETVAASRKILEEVQFHLRDSRYPKGTSAPAERGGPDPR
jgi:glycosyltransferase involved in cell wall biosynthesis